MYLNSVDNTFQTKMSEARRAKRGVNTSNASLKPSYEKPVKQMDTFVEKPVISDLSAHILLFFFTYTYILNFYFTYLCYSLLTPLKEGVKVLPSFILKAYIVTQTHH